MPELPEVHTTVEGIKKVASGKTILDVWSDFHLATAHGSRQTLKNKGYFDNFRKKVKGVKIVGVERRGKNILIHLNPSTRSGQVAYTIVIHMKMTGHMMYGKYIKYQKLNIKNKNESWRAVEEGPLQDPYNQYIHFVISLSDNKHLVLSDMRKFASVTLIKTQELHLHESVGALGIDPLHSSLTPKRLQEIIYKRKEMPIKSALLDQTGLAGIGNIYSDEILWETGIHPLSKANAIPAKKFGEVFKAMRKILLFSIEHGGDSKSDYRDIRGEKGGFQNFHKVYGKKGAKCPKKECQNKKGAIIERIVVRGRSAHFCPVHQKLYGRK